jgi:hypothetical protein
MRSNLYITLVLLMLAFVPACAVHLTGRVLSPSKIPLSGAAVSLFGTGLRDTTGPDGMFSFITDQTAMRTRQSPPIPVRLTGRGIAIRNTGKGTLLIEIFDLNGRCIHRESASLAEPRTRFFAFPGNIGHQFALIRTTMGDLIHTVPVLLGNNPSAGVAPSTAPEVDTFLKQTAVLCDSLEIAHPRIEPMRITLASCSASLEIRVRYWAMPFYKTVYAYVGDTLYNSKEKVWFSFDSIYTPQCSCNANYCSWGGTGHARYSLGTPDDTFSFAFNHPNDFSPINLDTTLLGIHLNAMPSTFCGATPHPSSLIAGYAPHGSKPYLFVEDFGIADGRVISGTDCPRVCIDFPFYGYNRDTGILWGVMNFDIGDSLLMLLGHWQSLLNAAGCGTASGLSPVYRLPYPAAAANVQYTHIRENGTLEFSLGDSAYVLPVNEHWSRTTVAQDTFGGCTVEKTETRTITNFGFLTNEQLKPHFE